MADQQQDPTVTIDMPGSFDEYFSGSSVGQGVYDEPAAEQLGAAYTAAVYTRRGKGYTRCMTMSAEAAWLLYEYAENPLLGGDYTPAEIRGARTTRDRISMALKELYTARTPLDSPVITPDGPGRVQNITIGDVCAYYAVRTDAGLRRYREEQIVVVGT